MTIIPSTTTLVNDDSAITLPRYAQMIEYSECQFMGVRATSTAATCRVIWTKPERDMVLKYLLEAQEEIEAILGYPLTRRWFADEQHPYRIPLKAKWCEVVEGGIKAVSNIALGEAVDHTTDPAVIGPVATTVTNTGEVHIYHPGTDIEIHPSAITISGGNMTIFVPRCRTVLAALADNDQGGLDYDDVLNFEATVDVKRVYNDTSTQAELVYPHGCTSCSCGEETKTGCITVRSGELGIVDVLPATYSGGQWNLSSSCGCGCPSYARLNYQAGLAAITRQHEDVIIRLAHSKMPFEPCKCDLATRVWQRDRNTPEILTAERLNCPFGLADGSWIAWRFANAMKIHRGGIL